MQVLPIIYPVLIIGFAAGIIGGMGIGGGTILIPALVFFIGIQQQVAQSINLISFIPTALVAIIVHLRKKNIETKLLLKITFFGIGGAVLGSLLAVNMNGTLLKKAFGVFLFIMGLYEMGIKRGDDKTNDKRGDF